jgi:hypothetical protein
MVTFWGLYWKNVKGYWQQGWQVGNPSWNNPHGSDIVPIDENEYYIVSYAREKNSVFGYGATFVQFTHLFLFLPIAIVILPFTTAASYWARKKNLPSTDPAEDVHTPLLDNNPLKTLKTLSTLKTEKILQIAEQMRLHLKSKPAQSNRSVRLQDMIEEYTSPNWRKGLYNKDTLAIENPHLEPKQRAQTAAKLQIAFQRYLQDSDNEGKRTYTLLSDCIQKMTNNNAIEAKNEAPVAQSIQCTNITLRVEVYIGKLDPKSEEAINLRTRLNAYGQSPSPENYMNLLEELKVQRRGPSSGSAHAGIFNAPDSHFEVATQPALRLFKLHEQCLLAQRAMNNSSKLTIDVQSMEAQQGEIDQAKTALC